MLPENYVVVLNSANGVGTYNAQKTYYFDWTTMPRGKYKISFSFVGKVNNIDGTKLALVNIQFGSSKVFTTGPSVAAQTSSFLGALQTKACNGANAYTFYGDNTLPPTYIDDRPQQTTFSVNIVDDLGYPFIDAAAVNTSVGSSIAGTVLTIAGAGGLQNFRPGSVLTGTGVTAGTYIVSSLTGTGGNGTYFVNVSQYVTATAISGTGTDLNGYVLALSFEHLSVAGV